LSATEVSLRTSSKHPLSMHRLVPCAVDNPATGNGADVPSVLAR
jgi:hypothetical protein